MARYYRRIGNPFQWKAKGGSGFTKRNWFPERRQHWYEARNKPTIVVKGKYTKPASAYVEPWMVKDIKIRERRKRYRAQRKMLRARKEFNRGVINTTKTLTFGHRQATADRENGYGPEWHPSRPQSKYRYYTGGLRKVHEEYIKNLETAQAIYNTQDTLGKAAHAAAVVSTLLRAGKDVTPYFYKWA